MTNEMEVSWSYTSKIVDECVIFRRLLIGARCGAAEMPYWEWPDDDVKLTAGNKFPDFFPLPMTQLDPNRERKK